MDFAVTISDAVATSDLIEIVPRYLLPANCQGKGWCQVDGVLGIAEKTLMSKFAELCSTYDIGSSPRTSLVAIIATNDNVTALNARKRMCLSGSVEATEEFRFVTVLLKSHLYKHSKSSMLWQHRRWLLLNFPVLQTSVRAEFQVVELAGTHHPKNYYAWAYLRWWCEWSQSSYESVNFDVLCDLTKSVCLRNLSDVSMWTFLHWLSREELEDIAVQTDRDFPGHPAILAATLIPNLAE